jgi:hypothetical protein
MMFARPYRLQNWSVPALTRSAGVNLNARVLLQAASELLSLSQSCGFWPTAHSRTAMRTARSEAAARASGGGLAH